MSAVPASVGAPRLPQVNLLPPEVEGKRKRSRTRALLIVFLLIFIVFLGLVWFGLLSWRIAVEAQLQAEQDRRPALVAELAEYDYVNGVQERYDNALRARNWVGLTDVTWSDYLDAFTSAVPSDVSLESVSVSQATAFSGAGTSNPFVTETVGTITFNGYSETLGDVSELQDEIDAISGFGNTAISVTAMGAGADGETLLYTYSGTTQITAEALSGRTIAEGSQLLESGDADATEDDS